MVWQESCEIPQVPPSPPEGPGASGEPPDGASTMPAAASARGASPSPPSGSIELMDELHPRRNASANPAHPLPTMRPVWAGFERPLLAAQLLAERGGDEVDGLVVERLVTGELEDLPTQPRDLGELGVIAGRVARRP